MTLRSAILLPALAACILAGCEPVAEPEPELRLTAFMRPTKFTPDYLVVGKGDRVVLTDTLDWGEGTIHDVDLAGADVIVETCYVGAVVYGGILDCKDVIPPVGYHPVDEATLEAMFPEWSSCGSGTTKTGGVSVGVSDCLTLRIFVRGNGPGLTYGWEPGWHYRVDGCGGSTWISWTVGRQGHMHSMLTDTIHVTMLPC